MDLLSPKFSHPFVQFEGADEGSDNLIRAVKGVQQLWNSTALWDYASFSEEGLAFELPAEFSKDEYVVNSFHPFRVDLSKSVDLLNTATKQKLLFAGLTNDDIPALLPFFKEGGWPLNNERVVGDVRVALRLSEPEDTAEEWLLETVD